MMAYLASSLPEISCSDLVVLLRRSAGIIQLPSPGYFPFCCPVYFANLSEVTEMVWSL